MTTLQKEPLHSEFGIKITGVDLAREIDDELMDEIRAAIDEYAFVYFPDQPFDDDRQLDFTRMLGEPEPDHVAAGDGRKNYFGTIGNVQQDGTALGASHKKTVFSTGNNMWHSDASFKAVPAFVSIMAAYETPDEGGETIFASGRSAYDRLTPEEKERVDPMIAIHDYVFSRSKVAPDAVSPGLAKTLPPVRQRLVRKNPRTGRKNLFLGSHVREIEGLSFEESRDLLDGLLGSATTESHQYSHAWKPGDFAIWDNRCLVHRGAGYDADKYRRYMRQTRVRGTCSSLEE